MLDLTKQLGGIAQLRVLLHLIANPRPHTVAEVRNALGTSYILAWTHLTNLHARGLVEMCGKVRVHNMGAQRGFYQVKGAHA